MSGYLFTIKIGVCLLHSSHCDFFTFLLVLEIPVCKFKELINRVEVSQVNTIFKEQLVTAYSLGKFKSSASRSIRQPI